MYSRTPASCDRTAQAFLAPNHSGAFVHARGMVTGAAPPPMVSGL